MEFEWDQQKNIENIAKHDFNFVDAPKIFRFAMRITLDERQNYGEDRWVGIGMVDGRTVVVVFTEPDEGTVRIISIRKALPYERKLYDEYLADQLGEI
jgi:uncharacterized protein